MKTIFSVVVLLVVSIQQYYINANSTNFVNFQVNNSYFEKNVLKEKEFRKCQFALIPGLENMRIGYDLLNFDFFPMNEKSFYNYGQRKVILEWSCNENDTWKHPINEIIYSKPDQIEQIKIVPQGSLDISVNIGSSLSEIKNSLEVQAGLSASYQGVGAFSASGGYKEARSNIIETNKVVALTQSHKSAYIIELKSPKHFYFSDKFTEAINNLPDKFENNQQKYQEFLVDFGTHWFEIGRFGGNIVMKTSFESKYFKSMKQSEIESKLKASCSYFGEIDTSLKEKSKKVDENFSSSSSTNFFYFGGDKELSEKNIKEWGKTVWLEPWLFSGKLNSIEYLIDNTTKAEQMKIAIEIYFARASIKELEDSIYLIKKYNILLAFSDEVKKDYENLKKFFDAQQKLFPSEELKKNLELLKDIINLASVASDCLSRN